MCVCVKERETERESMCVCEREREFVREGDREIVCERDLEQDSAYHFAPVLPALPPIEGGPCPPTVGLYLGS